MLDQFEEFCSTTHRNGGFAEDLAHAIRARSLPANFLIGIREDALARLDHFKGQIPNLFDNYLRLAHLDQAAGEDAIRGPVREYNRQRANGDAVVVDDDLVEAVLGEVASEQIGLGRTGQGGAALSGGIEAPFLQLVMTTLWAEELGRGSSSLRLATLQRLGGATRIVRSHFKGQMDALSDREQDLAARRSSTWLLHRAPRSRTASPDLAEYAGVAPDDLSPVLEKLSEGDWRILRPISDPADPDNPSYEIFHDVLTEAVLDWRTVHESQLAKVGERERLRRRWLPLLMVAMGLVAVASSLLTIWALSKRSEAQSAREEANSRQLATMARQQLRTKPELGILLAREVIERPDDPPREAVEALRTALGNYRGRGVLSGHTGRLWGYRFQPGRKPDRHREQGWHRAGLGHDDGTHARQS